MSFGVILMMGQWIKLFTMLNCSNLQILNNFGPQEGVKFELQKFGEVSNIGKYLE
jgi:hypothetical protein